jgi:hypothetical protein
MSEEQTDTRRGLSRRAFTGLGLAAGATAAVVALPGVPALAGPPTVTPIAAGALQPDALGTANPALTYMTLDAFAFFNDSTTISTPPGTANQRIYQDATGVQPAAANARLSASLPIPSGSSIFQLNVAYQQQPIIEIWKRSMTAPTPFGPAFQQSVPMGAGPSTATFDFSPPIVVEPATTVAVRFFATAGSSVFGVTIGYTPPSQSFIPFTGAAPRVLDTRTMGGPLAANEERTIALGFPGARGAVLNLTVTETQGRGGFVAVFPANIAWPGNSSVNWFGPNQNIADGVITALDASGQIKIRGGVAPTQVVIDRIGWLI